MKCIFDIETNGLLDKLTHVHSLEIATDTGKFLHCHDGTGYLPILDGVNLLQEADEIIGHNIITFDVRALHKVYPLISFRGKVIDTLLLSRMLFPDIDLADMIRGQRDKKFMEDMKAHKLIGKHSLKAWGFRLGIYKGTFGETTDWAHWTPEMQTYCAQDVQVTVALYQYLMQRSISWEAYQLEYEFQLYAMEQEEHGCYFDVGKAIQLKQKLTKELDETLEAIKQTVPSWREVTIFEPKKANKVKGYVVGQKYERVKVIPFNPNSRMQIERFLKEKYQWEPSVLTKTGRAKIDADILDELEALDWIEAKYFSKFLTLTKLIGYISEGDNAWLKLVRDGKLHGQMITCGAVTRRCTHSKPNLGQVPSVKKYMGKECRELFYAPNGFKFVGADLSGIELRCFAHYLAQYDKGAYAEVILQGDIHVKNQKDAGLPTRDNAKTFIYGVLYGAGAAKVGMITHPHATLAERERVGKQLKDNFMRANPAYASLVNDVKFAMKTRGWIKGIDGHILKPRQIHSALNTLLQNCGAVISKKFCTLFREEMIKRGWWMISVFPVLQVHDEGQCLALPEIAEEVGKIMVDCMRQAGEFYKLKIRIDGEYKIGNNWKETH